MRRIIAVMCLIGLAACQQATDTGKTAVDVAQGVQFVKGTVAEALTMAQKENRQVMVDVYSDT